MEMVGQKHNIEIINTMLDNFPKFLILVGKQGSGKKTLSKYIANKLNANFALCGIKVDEIRDVTNTAMTINSKAVYCIADADKMKNEAKNAMLKITEEPPINAYFILTVCNEYDLLDTIKSRAMLMHMDKYTIEELKRYKPNLDNNMYEVAKNLYDLDLLEKYGVDFFKYVDLVYDNIALVGSANAFKSSKELSIKNEDGYDVCLFWEAFMKKCVDNLVHGNYVADWVRSTAKCINLCNRSYSNLEMLYDWWVLDIRRSYYETTGV